MKWLEWCNELFFLCTYVWFCRMTAHPKNCSIRLEFPVNALQSMRYFVEFAGSLHPRIWHGVWLGWFSISLWAIIIISISLHILIYFTSCCVLDSKQWCCHVWHNMCQYWCWSVAVVINFTLCNTIKVWNFILYFPIIDIEYLLCKVEI